MDSRVLKVFVAVAFGAFVGTLVSFEVNGAIWWVGLLAGGLVGYLFYKPMKVVRAIPCVASVAARQAGSVFEVFMLIVAMILLFGTGILILLFWGAPIALTLTASKEIRETAQANIFLMFALMMGMAWSCGLLCYFTAVEKKKKVRNIKNIATSILRYSPIPVTALLLYRMIESIPSTMRFMIFFVPGLFRLIHSDIRLLCSADAAIGTVIGYFTGSALTGALLGGLFGVLNFEILSKRILKLVPMRSQS